MMILPIDTRWDLAVKVHVTVTRMAITDRDISNEVVKPHPVEMVDWDIVIPYPHAGPFFGVVGDYIRAYPEGIKIYDTKGREVLNLGTGELYPAEDNEADE